MRHSTYLTILFWLIGLLACRDSPTIYATKWTNEIKKKIIVDANQQFDRSTFDSTTYFLTLYKGNTKLKRFSLRPTLDETNGKILWIDTVACFLYSADQKFELVRELCPAIDRGFEAIYYKDIGWVGLTELRYCDGKIKESGFRFGNKQVGIWTIYDSTGKVIESKDNGDTDILKKLRDVKYYR